MAFLLGLILLLPGCATKISKDNSDKPYIPRIPTASPIETISKSDIAEIADGVIFGKVDFRGLLKVDYVKLNIIDERDPQKHYELVFSGGDQYSPSGWDARPVDPHYFFLELPAGRYRISTISIPVGTAVAAEQANISFEVEKGTVIYLGTLRVTGTNQKIRFGGVPLLRPGFEYRVEIADERETAIAKFKNRYPGVNRNVQVKLMKDVLFQAF